MKNPLKGIDFGKEAMTTLGEFGGIASVTLINRIPFVQKIEKPALKGATLIVAGKLLLPLAAKWFGLSKSMEPVVTGVKNGISVMGEQMLGNAVAPNIFPKVSGVTGYEESVYGTGMGLLVDEDQVNAVSGDADVYGDD